MGRDFVCKFRYYAAENGLCLDLICYVHGDCESMLGVPKSKAGNIYCNLVVYRYRVLKFWIHHRSRQDHLTRSFQILGFTKKEFN